MPSPTTPRPRDLREALNFAFVHRTAARWHAGTSALLNVRYPGPSAGPVVDVRRLADFTAVQRTGSGLSIGAFANAETIETDPSVASALGGAPTGPAAARFRLAALGARMLIAGPGATRTAPLGLETAPLPEHEVPVAVILNGSPPIVWFGDRLIRRRDGAASFEMSVHVALTLAGVHRIDHATVAAVIDGRAHTLTDVAALLDGTIISKTTFATAARRGADLFDGNTERLNVQRRTIVPLLLSALNDAYKAARAARSPRSASRQR